MQSSSATEQVAPKTNTPVKEERGKKSMILSKITEPENSARVERNDPLTAKPYVPRETSEQRKEVVSTGLGLRAKAGIAAVMLGGLAGIVVAGSVLLSLVRDRIVPEYQRFDAPLSAPHNILNNTKPENNSDSEQYLNRATLSYADLENIPFAE